MFLLILITLLIIFLSGKPRFQSHMVENGLYMSRERTMMINGFFIWIVFIQHMKPYGLDLSIFDKKTVTLLSYMGQCCVATFLFYSGYGIMSALHRKTGGGKYINKLIIKRLPRLLLHMTMAVCIYWLLQTLYGNSYDFAKIILAFIGWDSLGNSNWFICVTLIGYILIAVAYWSSHRFGENVFLVTVTTLFIALICVLIYCNKGTYWYNTCLCIPAGMAYCRNRLMIEKVVKYTRIPAWIHGGILVCGALILYRLLRSIPYLNNISAIIFALGVTMVFSCISLKRIPVVLSWSGGAGLFYLYIFQRIPMIIGANHEWQQYSTFLYQLFCFVITLLLAFGASILFSKIDSVIFKKE